MAYDREKSRSLNDRSGNLRERYSDRPVRLRTQHPCLVLTIASMSNLPRGPEAKKLLGGSVEESRAKRVEKQQSRYRDRGGYALSSSRPRGLSTR